MAAVQSPRLLQSKRYLCVNGISNSPHAALSIRSFCNGSNCSVILAVLEQAYDRVLDPAKCSSEVVIELGGMCWATAAFCKKPTLWLELAHQPQTRLLKLQPVNKREIHIILNSTSEQKPINCRLDGLAVHDGSIHNDTEP